ncbi:bifunctional DNA primase/polymerase [Parasphingorhabdus flavimaris]|uniref:bifunctional DNA primase/polymerase n=1 Tax=Parasphingorhabdus flavimaris TaxID=266812 RepID=UPI003002DD7C
MAGAFATWQPRYEEAGIATFPVDAVRKSPSVGNYHRGGLPASRQWAKRFADSNALGFNCGKRNGLTVLDIDAPDEKLLADSLDRFGPSPVIIKTASGKFHVWYKHNGEGRKIRPEKHIPIDVLGGGYAVAPPSAASGGQYQFIEGSLNDLGRLRPMHVQLGDNDAVAPDKAAPDALAGVGERNATLWRSAMLLARSAGSYEILLQQVGQDNVRVNNPPLPQEEVIRIAASAWAKQRDGSNWIGSGQRVVSTFDDIDRLLVVNPDAFILLTMLKRHNWGSNFYAANAMANSMPGGGWRRQRFTAARKYLIDIGYLVCVRPASKEAGAALYRFAE